MARKKKPIVPTTNVETQPTTKEPVLQSTADLANYKPVLELKFKEPLIGLDINSVIKLAKEAGAAVIKNGNN